MQCLNGKKVQRLRDHDAGKGRHLEGSPTQANKPKGTGRKFTVQKTYKFKQAGNRFFRCQVTDKQKTKSRMQAHAHMITLTIGQGMSGKGPVKYCRADEGNWKQERVGRVGLVTEGLMRRENRCVERRSSQGLRKGGEV